MIKYCTLPLLFILPLCSFSQLNFQWANATGGSDEFDVCRAVAVDNDKNVIVTASFYGIVDFDPGAGEFYLDAGTAPDVGIVKYDSAGVFIWAKKITSGGANSSAVKVDDDGNILFAGACSGISDLDPGPDVSEYTGFYFFLEKLDPDGNLIWFKLFGTGGWSRLNNMSIDLSGNILLTGYLDSYLDCDPGPGEYGLSDPIWIIKLDSEGNFIWAHEFGAFDNGEGMGVDTDEFGNVWLCGAFSGTADFDPGPGTFNLTSDVSIDGFVVKLSVDGDFLWAGMFVNDISGSENLYDLKTDSDNNVIISGGFGSTIDFDPGPDTYNLYSPENDIFIVKLDDSGNFIWAVNMGDQGYSNTTQALTINEEDEIIISGLFTGPTDFDPGPGSTIISSGMPTATFNSFVAKYDAAGNYLWAAGYGNELGDYARAVYVEGSNIYVAGIFEVGFSDFDPGGGQYALTSNGTYDFYVMKLTETACSDFTIVFDSVANASCDLPGFAAASTLNGDAPFDFIWPESDPIVHDSINTFFLAGTYNLTVTDANTCQKETTLIIEGPTELTEADMTGNITYAGFSPGFLSTLWVDVFNNGCLAANGNVTVILDPLQIFNNAEPFPDFISGDTLQWNYNDVIYNPQHLTYEIFTTTSLDATLDDHVDFHLLVEADSDSDSLNNYKKYSVQVVGSFDPNNKIAYPSGECDLAYILPTQEIIYTINFQNTGTAEAVNIVITDTLSTKLNRNTLHIIAGSHEMYSEISDDNILKFTFPEIYLPDSTTDEPGSHGYVMFEILPKSGLADGVQIKNKAEIYFDFNDPIITNTTLHTIESEIPVYAYMQSLTICNGESFIVGDNEYTFQGTYHDLLYTVNGCDSNVTTILSVIHVDDSVVINDGDLISNESSAEYQWISCDDNSLISGETGQVFHPATTGEYAVIITVDGCSDTSLCTYIVITEIEEIIPEQKLVVKPNPAKEIALIECSEMLVNKELEIFSSTGQLVYFCNIASTNFNIDISNFSSGIYYIKSESISLKLVKY